MDDENLLKIIQEDILVLLYRSTKDEPLSLQELIEGIDARQRMIVSYEELYHAIANLVSENKVIELKKLYYTKADDQIQAPNSFSGFSKEDYNEAVSQYTDMMEEIINKIKDGDFDGDEEEDDFEKIFTISWYIGKRKIDSEIEITYNKFADYLEDNLDITKYEIVGFEHGYDQISNSIILWIYGDLNYVEQSNFDEIKRFTQNFSLFSTGTIQIEHHNPLGENELWEMQLS